MDNDQYKADMDAIRHELEAIWEAINLLQGIEPAEAGEPQPHEAKKRRVRRNGKTTDL